MTTSLALPACFLVCRSGTFEVDEETIEKYLKGGMGGFDMSQRAETASGSGHTAAPGLGTATAVTPRIGAPHSSLPADDEPDRPGRGPAQL